MHISIDFETRSRGDIRRLGGWQYSTQAWLLCFAYKVDDGPVQIWRSGANPNITEDPFPEVLREAASRSDTIWHAWNASFEYAIWTNVVVPTYGVTPIPLRQWDCTLARAAAMSLPRKLEDAPKALGLDVAKDSEGHRVMLQMTKPRKPSKNDPSEFFDDPTRYQKLYDYCIQDVVVESQILALLPALHPMERQIWILDQEINLRGVPIDVELANAAIRLNTELQATRRKELEKLTGGVVKTSQQALQLTKWLTEHGCNVDNVQAATVRAALQRTDLDPVVRRVLEIRQETSASSVAKYAAMRDLADDEGRARGCHQYYGANTGRWAGRGIQPQNFPRKGLGPLTDIAADTVLHGSLGAVELLWGDSSAVLQKLLRSTIAAGPNKLLAFTDYSQIESRVLCWCAGQDDMLDVFRHGQDVYKVMATKIYEVPYEDITDDDPRRQIGKIAVLGLGYGMGIEKFIQFAALYGITLPESQAKDIVDIFRSSNSRIPQWWKSLETAARSAITNTTKAYWAEKVGFCMHREWLLCKLPSGRGIAYYKPTIETVDGKWGKASTIAYWSVPSSPTGPKKWSQIYTFGGKIAENVVQGISRDLLAHSMLRLNAAGHDIVFHVHDEVVLEVPPDTQIEQIDAIMTSGPDWSEGLPLAAKGRIAKRYAK